MVKRDSQEKTFVVLNRSYFIFHLSSLRRLRRTITLIILHCSATRTTQKYTFRQCKADHMRLGYKDIGYHYYITRDGQVHEGRPVWQVGAHCKGHNRHSIGVCYEGGLDAAGYPADAEDVEG